MASAGKGPGTGQSKHGMGMGCIRGVGSGNFNNDT